MGIFMITLTKDQSIFVYVINTHTSSQTGLMMIVFFPDTTMHTVKERLDIGMGI
jgi:hypothetical protein